jgi:hypothetical protein
LPIGQLIHSISIVFIDLANGAINSGVIKYTAEYEKEEVKLKGYSVLH